MVQSNAANGNKGWGNHFLYLGIQFHARFFRLIFFSNLLHDAAILAMIAITAAIKICTGTPNNNNFTWVKRKEIISEKKNGLWEN